MTQMHLSSRHARGCTVNVLTVAGLSVQVAAISQPGLIFSTLAGTRGASLSVREAAELQFTRLCQNRDP